MKGIALLACAAAVASSVARADTRLSLVGASLSPSNDSVVVRILKPVPPFAAVSDRALWQISQRTRQRPEGAPLDIQEVREGALYPLTGQVRLVLRQALAERPDSITVTLLLGRPATATWRPRQSAAQALGFYPVDRRAKADVYLYGAVESGTGS